MSDFSAIVMIKALDGLYARATVTAQNIANAQTPGYRPLQVSFEQALSDAAAQGADAVASVTPRIDAAAPDTTDGKLRLDLEMSTAAGTAGRYGAIADILNRELQLQSLAVTGTADMQAMEISRTALNVEWRRIELASENLANLNSARGTGGTLYRAQHILSGPIGNFAAHLDTADMPSLKGVEVKAVVSDDAAPRLMHEPGNPAADANGMVTYPGIDHAQEMLTLVEASRTYEANIVAMNAARQIYAKALEIGRHS